MRVAFLLGEFPVLSETFILNQITGLLERGCEVDVYARTIKDGSEVHPDVTKYRLLERAHSLAPPHLPHDGKLRRLLSAVRDVGSTFRLGPRAVARSLDPWRFGAEAAKFRVFYRVAPFLRSRAYDVIHCHFGPNGQLACSLRDLGATRAPIVTHFHGYDVSSFVRQNGVHVYKELFEKGELFLCVSNRIRSRIIELGCSPARAVLHRVGVDLQRTPFLPRKIDVREKVRLLSVARLEEKKGIEYALRAVSSLLQRYPTIRYTVVGDGSLKRPLMDLVRRLGIESQVDLAGWMLSDQVTMAMATANVLLVPSVAASNGDEEGLPTVVMEALASGLPVVASDHAGIPELVVHGKSGLLASERSSDELAQQVEYLISHPEHASSMSQYGRQLVEQNHDIDTLNDRLLELYRGLQRPAHGR